MKQAGLRRKRSGTARGSRGQKATIIQGSVSDDKSSGNLSLYDDEKTIDKYKLHTDHDRFDAGRLDLLKSADRSRADESGEDEGG